MKFTAAVAAAAFALVPGTYGWAQAGNGVWIANNSWYTIRGGESPFSRPSHQRHDEDLVKL